MPLINEIKMASELGINSWNKHIFSPCVLCGQPRWVRLIKNKPEHDRCRKCMGLGRRAERGAAWEGGRGIDGDGYILIYLKSDDFFFPMATRKRSAWAGYVLEHRFVVAKALGRNLHSWEIVHHKHAKYPAGSIENKQDNRYPENLQLVSDDRHKQITILENRIAHLEKRVTLLEAENIILRTKLEVGRCL